MDGGKDVNYMTMELAYCDTAAFLVGYEDTNCETNHTLTQELFKQHTVTTDLKYVSQFFNPSIYYQNRQMDFWSTNQQAYYLADTLGMVQYNRFNVRKSNATVYDNIIISNLPLVQNGDFQGSITYYEYMLEQVKTAVSDSFIL